MTTRIDISLMGVYSKCHGHRKLTRIRIKQKSPKKIKSQET
jgi:hypothetical protein